MKKKYIFSVIAVLCTFYYCLGQSVIISQYIETSSGSTPKGIEIFNVSGADIIFSPTNNLQVYQGTNGGACSSNLLVNITSGTLATDEVWVIGTADLTAYAISNGTDLSGTTNQTFLFNGDDALEIQLGGVVQDMFGTCGSDPGSAWNGGGVTTRNNNLQIKDGICVGDTDGWTDPSVRFDQIATGTVRTGFGNAPASCVVTDTRVQFSSVTSSVAENGTSISVCVSIINPSPTTATTVDVELDVSSVAINGTDYDDSGSPFVFPIPLTFPANSSADQCITISIIDDLVFEGDEILVLNLNNASGGIAADVGFDSQHVLTIVDDETPVIADVVITEIMYNTPGIDDEWIEICNTTGITQVLNDYTVRVNGITRYTFPASGATIPAGGCITIGLGDDGDAEFNDGNGTVPGGYCPFTPTYTNGSSSGILGNSGATITVIADDGSTTIDSVTYSNTDGANGNGASLHVTDDSLDNSDTGTNWQEVIDGGSPGFNTLISQCSPLEPEINVESGNSPFPNINNGAAASGLLNTQFSTNIDIVAGSETRAYRIQNIGTADLDITNIEIVGTHPGDFSVTSPAVLNFTVGDVSTGSNVVVFEVTFDPTAVGTRDAIVRITNNDTTDSENPFEFAISGGGVCSTASNTLTPLSGPANTVVTISGSDLGGSTTVEFGGTSVPITSISATEIEITIPSGASTNSIVVTNDIGCQTTDIFTVIDNTISGCQGTTGLSPTDLFISEVTDAPTGSHTYIEIFNGTGAAVNLDDYELRVHNNGSNNAAGDIADLTGILADGDTYVIGIGGSNAGDAEGGFTADDTFAISGINNNDNIRLYFDDGVTETWLDVWGDTNGSIFTVASAGYTYRRKNTGITVPRTDGWNGPAASDDMINDWDAITPVNYDDIGSFDFSTGAPPTIVTNPMPQSSSCDLTASFFVSASEGLPGGFGLEYRWFVAAPGAGSYSQLSDGGVYSGANTANLNISDTSGLEGYQYYCQVWENTNTCFTASEAVRVITQSTRWQNPGVWSNGTPDINTIAYIEHDFTTATDGGSFSACRLIVDSGAQLTVSNNTYVEIDTDVTVDGNIVVDPYANFVQIDDSGIVNGDVLSTKSRIVVRKETAILQTNLEYTYWSSPVANEIIGDGLDEASTGRRFRFNAAQYRDSFAESMNDNSATPGQDDIDDDANDWEQILNDATVMAPCVGYAATHSSVGFIGPGTQYIYTFEGPFNNGVYLTPVYRNDGEGMDNNWNFIGNPYPSAIAVDGVNGFFARNVYNVSTNPSGALDGAIYLWSHNTAAQDDQNGNEAYNYAQSDYAIINGTGETVGGDGILPNRFIPSGQGFFVTMSDDVAAVPSTPVIVRTTDVEFNNAMRVTGNNDQFFRNNNLALPNKIRLNLTSDNGVFSQILVGYVEGATDQYDGSYYDASKVLSSSTNAMLYSSCEDSDKRFAIQGKAISSLSLDEVIPLGFYSSIAEPTLYSLSIADVEGEFMTNNTVFLRDRILNSIHNLTESDYTFTSEVGEFTDRFEIVFQSETLSTDDDQLGINDIQIIELPNGHVKFNVGRSQTIETVEIIDLLGRTLYNFKGENSTEIYQLDALSQSAYLAKIKLSNGQTVVKRAIKRL